MAAVHGRLTKITVATKDISAYCKTSSYEKTADVHDTTGYGETAKRKTGGLLEGKFTCGGTYDNTASTGPANALKPAVGTTVAVTRLPEGSGTGKPSEAFSAVLSKYTETAPVDDVISWSAEFELDGVVTTTTQP